MKMSLTVEGLRSDLDAVAELGDEMVAEVAQRISGVLARSAPSRLLDLLSEVAAELSDELPGGHIEVRVVGDDVHLAYLAAEEDQANSEVDAELSARITLRLPEGLKARVEDAASQQGVSVNGWILRTLERGVVPSSSGRTSVRGSKRLQGFGTS